MGRGLIIPKISSNQIFKIIDSLLNKLPSNSELFNEKDIVLTLFNITRNKLNSIEINYKSLLNLNNIIRENSRKYSLGFFILDVIGDKFKLNWHHIEWINLVQKETFISIIASRDLGKTFFFKMVCLWKAYRYNKNSKFDEFKQREAIILSENQDMSNSKLEDIKEFIETNPILKEKLYPKNDGIWSVKRIKCKNGFSLTCKGFDAAIRGMHVHFILLDDVIKDEATFSGDYRKKNINKFKKTIIPILKGNKGSQIVLINTPRHAEDLTGYVKNALSDTFKHKEYPAIFPDGRICWDWKLSYDFLQIRRNILGEIGFAQEYLCKAISDSTSLFPYEILESSKDTQRSYVDSLKKFDLYNNTLYIISGSDFAKSASVSADDSVHIVFAITNNRHLYCLCMKTAKGLGYLEQMGLINNIEYFFKPNIIALENNGFQGLYEEIYKTQYKFSKVKGYFTGKQKNDWRIGVPSIRILFERGLIHMPYKTDEDKLLTNQFLAQFNSISFTDKGLKAISGHDDIVFATYVAKQAIDEIDKDFSFNIIET